MVFSEEEDFRELDDALDEEDGPNDLRRATQERF